MWAIERLLICNSEHLWKRWFTAIMKQTCTLTTKWSQSVTLSTVRSVEFNLYSVQCRSGAGQSDHTYIDTNCAYIFTGHTHIDKFTSYLQLLPVPGNVSIQDLYSSKCATSVCQRVFGAIDLFAGYVTAVPLTSAHKWVYAVSLKLVAWGEGCVVRRIRHLWLILYSMLI